MAWSMRYDAVNQVATCPAYRIYTAYIHAAVGCVPAVLLLALQYVEKSNMRHIVAQIKHLIVDPSRARLSPQGIGSDSRILLHQSACMASTQVKGACGAAAALYVAALIHTGERNTANSGEAIRDLRAKQGAGWCNQINEDCMQPGSKVRTAGVPTSSLITLYTLCMKVGAASAEDA